MSCVLYVKDINDVIKVEHIISSNEMFKSTFGKNLEDYLTGWQLVHTQGFLIHLATKLKIDSKVHQTVVDLLCLVQKYKECYWFKN